MPDAGRRFTSTMPAATSTSAATSPGVTGSLSNVGTITAQNAGVAVTGNVGGALANTGAISAVRLA